jgi:hypothetical protein
MRQANSQRLEWQNAGNNVMPSGDPCNPSFRHLEIMRVLINNNTYQCAAEAIYQINIGALVAVGAVLSDR